MFAVAVKIEGVKPESSKFVKTAENIDQILKSKSAVKESHKYGREMLNNAKGIVPVRSGNLRDNGLKLEESDSGFVFYVDTNAAPYGPLVERGTHKMEAQPYYWPSVDKVKEKMIAGLIAHYKGKTA
jgi:HK97 gp10 family phage protein